MGKPQNLLGWRGYDFLNKIDEVKKSGFASVVRDVLYGAGTTGERVERFSGSFKDLLEGTGSRLIPSQTREVPTFFLMLAFPMSEIFVKTNRFNTAGQLIMGLPP